MNFDLGSDPWLLLVAAIAGYVVGSINPAAIIARVRGIDLHAEGSGNPGATNAARVMGKGTGVLVGIIDVLKGFVPAIVFSRYGPGPGEVAGLAAVVGHITSPFLKGHGGKGVATTLGALLGTEPLWVPFILVGFAVGFLIWRRVGLGAVTAAVVLLGCAAVTQDADAKLFGFLLGLLVIARHWKNIVEAWQGWRGTGSGPADPAE